MLPLESDSEGGTEKGERYWPAFRLRKSSPPTLQSSHTWVKCMWKIRRRTDLSFKEDNIDKIYTKDMFVPTLGLYRDR